MSKLLKEHLEGLLVDLAQAQDILDKVLTYNTVDLWSASSFATLIKRRKMAQAEQVLERIRDKIARLLPGYLPAPPNYDAKKGLYWDYLLDYSVAKDTKAVQEALTDLTVAVKQRLVEVEAYLADRSV